MGTEEPVKKLPREFYLRDTLDVARELLGKELVHRSAEGTASGIIVETEAYLGTVDRASHAFGGRLTRRTSVMFDQGGRAYIYLIYGMYWCLNITTREAGTPECVLIRGVQPVAGIDLMVDRRHAAAGKPPATLTNGPGKLCLALGIDGSLNGADLCGGELYVLQRPPAPEEQIGVSPRVNIGYAGEAVHHEWRFFLRHNPFVSRP